MPSATKDNTPIFGGHPESQTVLKEPLQNSGSLDSYEYTDLTPAIGREIAGLQISDLLTADDKVIQDFALITSQRGVVFLRDQNATPQQQKEFVERLTKLAGCPTSSGLHRHPLTQAGSELGDQVRVISSAEYKKAGGLPNQRPNVTAYASNGWHSDISWEKVPADYSLLKISTLPATGGDTLWASGYEVYDRLSPAFRALLEPLTATHDGNFFHDEGRKLGNSFREGPRGSHLNISSDLSAEHPVIRTNPVTGWKAVYVNKNFTKRINGVTKDESDKLLEHLINQVKENHDLQVRFRWTKNALAIWDNRSTFHSATFDYSEDRVGDRVCSLGEAPYFDPNSVSRREALGL